MKQFIFLCVDNQYFKINKKKNLKQKEQCPTAYSKPLALPTLVIITKIKLK
jgi:hypothetical protein